METINAFFQKHGPDILEATWQHILLTFIAVFIAIAIALPTGIVLARSKLKSVCDSVMGAASIIQTIPSLALIAFIVVIFALVKLPTVGAVPAVVALVLYALLPILRNTYTGIRQVDPAVLEVARGMGMRPRQVLLQVELPLSLPVIMAGIRIATVWTIGVATLCGFIGAGGLGTLIIRGLRSIQVDYLMAGTIPAGLLAIGFDAVLSQIEKALSPAAAQQRPQGNATLRRMKIAAAAAALAVVALVVVPAILSSQPSDTRTREEKDAAVEGKAEILRPAFDAEFFTRPDGYEGLKRQYDFDFNVEPRQMAPGLMYKSAADGAVDVIDAYATDGRIPAYDLKVLVDDQHFFPPYYAAPLVRIDTLKKHPELADLLNELGGRIDNARMQKLNYRVDEKGEKPADVARSFLVDTGLIEAEASPGSGQAGSVAIGSKTFTEQEILGEMLAILIETRTDIAVKRRLPLGGSMICFNALKAGDLDLYAEYTGTGLVNILDMDAISDPDRAYEVVLREFRERFQLEWLEPFGFNNTYTLTMRRAQAERLGIETFSDLADYVRGHDAP